MTLACRLWKNLAARRSMHRKVVDPDGRHRGEYMAAWEAGFQVARDAFLCHALGCRQPAWTKRKCQMTEEKF